MKYVFTKNNANNVNDFIKTQKRECRNITFIGDIVNKTTVIIVTKKSTFEKSLV